MTSEPTSYASLQSNVQAERLLNKAHTWSKRPALKSLSVIRWAVSWLSRTRNALTVTEMETWSKLVEVERGVTDVSCSVLRDILLW